MHFFMRPHKCVHIEGSRLSLDVVGDEQPQSKQLEDDGAATTLEQIQSQNQTHQLKLFKSSIR